MGIDAINCQLYCIIVVGSRYASNGKTDETKYSHKKYTWPPN